MQLFISNIPEGINHHKLRRALGSAILKISNTKVKFKVYLRGRGQGKLILGDENDKVAFELTNNRLPVIVKDARIYFKYDRYIDKEQVYWDQRQLEALNGDDIASDYEVDDVNPAHKTLKAVQISCGAWDSEGRYVDAWARICDPSNDTVTIDEDRGRLLLHFSNGEIRINIYNIKYTIVDRSFNHLYLVLRGLPTFIESHKYVKFRVSNFGERHEKTAGYCYVYRIQYFSRLDLFLKSHARRLISPVVVKITPSSIVTLSSTSMEEILDDFYRTLPFDTAFQVQALVTSWQVLPIEIYNLRLSFYGLDKMTGAARVKALSHLIQWRDPRPGKNQRFSVEDIRKFLLEDVTYQEEDKMMVDDVPSEKRARLAFYRKREEQNRGDAVYIHCLSVSPAGMQLSGPFQDAGNRIVRQYPGLDNQYLRVTFKDEMGEMIKEERGVDSQSRIIMGKFKRIFTNDLVVGGCRFEFLAFSNSQLKSHGCWFVRSPLVIGGGKMIFPNTIRDSIGNLSSIQCPPRFAARLGQAFTTTLYSIKVPIENLYRIDEVESPCKKYKFSDGVGRISPDMVALLNKAAGKGRDDSEGKDGSKGRATNVFQIRLDGCKGVLALDTTLQGKSIQLRPSMVKFLSTDTEMDLAVATSYSRPLRFYLQRPLIALLESLGVPQKSFKALQDESLIKIGAAASNTSSAARLLQELGLGLSTRVNSTLLTLQKEFGIDAIAEIPFFKEVIRTAVSLSLRVMKYKARIRVPDSYTLMGIMDESGTVKEGQVYACLQMGTERTYLKGRHLVLRSPTLHPGDVQYANAIGEVSKTSPLYALTNCLVFSRLGKRPLPSMLAGGDLDGDLYNIIGDERLFPNQTHQPAEYSPIVPLDIGRPVETNDVIEFFLQYIVNDKVGMLANKHLIVSDQSDRGVLHAKCIKLAEKYSIALDYPKTGKQVDIEDLPKTYGKPDYMEHEYRVEERSETSMEKLKLLARGSLDFYRSRKALGVLFRQIEVSSLLKRWGLEGEPVVKEISNDWEGKLLKILKPRSDRWVRFLAHQRLMVKFYYEEEESMAIGYHTEGRSASLSSAEVVLGCILLKSPFQASKNLFEAAESLRGNFRDLVERFLTAASNPVESETEDISEMTRLLQKMESKEEARQESLLYDDDDDDDDGDTVRSQDFEEYDDDDAERESSWQEIDSHLTSTEQSQNGREDLIAEELHASLYALFFAALEVQRRDPEKKMSCPWVVYPRLLAAKKNVQRIRALEHRY